METVHTDCRFFRGDTPCSFHKSEGIHCQDCSHYEPIDIRILLIKLGAVGDVIRTTPLLRRLWQEFPHAHITWLTHTPEVVPRRVDRVLLFDPAVLVYLLATNFDLLYNLDKDAEACAVAELVQAKQKYGFGLRHGYCYPLNSLAEHKFLTGLFDDLNRANRKSYPQEIFEICGFEFEGEKYVLDRPSRERQWTIVQPHPLIGLNTGCGERWKTRLWPDEYWIELAKKLQQAGMGVLFLGGAQEHEKNLRLSHASGGSYLGYFPLPEFIQLVDQCDLLVTAVTMALHVAIGLEKRVVLFNNIFNRYEFELYGLGEILEPAVECVGCYRQKCDIDCMQMIEPELVLQTVREILKM
ncbi:glycosyltransferase family 9 protein [candidate division KSB1 bacterium]|nr:MAG: hypothetical protein B5M50_02715 [candidate division KSB1 bacterium 4484_219]RKY79155.1 MAG: glycosyltransferase family 9 protein [candidate division KSB1 bacterium]RKY85468.1 MAG: glycosyltransferase family 9 protein [candidate division KSB1 bacterium]RKY92940.1 MAG: glycosyltransferase family 9 protein [candidate division KSB1 bacterium]HDI52072.1 glycosyltransferase family 9 protein [Bacteroidota bacterium]